MAWWVLAGATMLILFAALLGRASLADRVVTIPPVIVMNMVMLRYASKRLVEIERQTQRGDSRWISMLVVLSILSLGAAFALGTVRN